MFGWPRGSTFDKEIAMKKLASSVVATIVVAVVLVVALSGKRHMEELTDESFGIAASEIHLKDGAVYHVESFLDPNQNSCGYLAQLRENDALMSRQYRLTRITQLEPGHWYKAVLVRGELRTWAYFREVSPPTLTSQPQHSQ